MARCSEPLDITEEKEYVRQQRLSEILSTSDKTRTLDDMSPHIKKVLFDTNAFSDLALQPQYAGKLDILKKKIRYGTIQVLGSITFLEEISGLGKSKYQNYLFIIDEYRRITNAKILKPVDELIQFEIDNLRTPKQDELFLDEEMTERMYQYLKERGNLNSLDEGVYQNKLSYRNQMDKTFNNTLGNELLINVPRKELRKMGDEWHDNLPIYIVEWVKQSLGLEKSDATITDLLHITSFWGYALTKIHQRLRNKIPDKNSDTYDRAHYTDAAAADILITGDRTFRRLCEVIPYRKVELMDLNELFGDTSSNTG